ncbi:MAG TPA: exodeoxyribonuclease III, partial [Bacteroidetes bacterium]|nr:exodeoxyribonuclease III [Bacteroidota bacterium]HEX05408.1 exodeoxyribonuclease III [Bacteroidota bacterium]
NPQGYFSVFSQAEKKGYSGVGTFSKVEPDSVQIGFGDGAGFDSEGRLDITEHLGGKLLVANVYFPNGKARKERLDYKMNFYEHIFKYFNKLKDSGRNIIVCGDYNTAHKPIDLSHPKNNEKSSGFLPIERAWIDRWVDSGWMDSFRMFDSSPDKYSWWDMRTRARERGIGWRIDYHFATESLRSAIVSASISDEVVGSDHCPIWIEIDETAL